MSALYKYETDVSQTYIHIDRGERERERERERAGEESGPRNSLDYVKHTHTHTHTHRQRERERRKGSRNKRGNADERIHVMSFRFHQIGADVPQSSRVSRRGRQVAEPHTFPRVSRPV